MAIEDGLVLQIYGKAVNVRLIGKYINKLYAAPTAMNEFDNSAIIRIGGGPSINFF